MGGTPKALLVALRTECILSKGESLFNKKYFSQCEKYFFTCLIFAKAIALARIRKKIIVNYNSLEQILTIAVLIIILKKSPKWMTY